ncbi:MAG: polysaccharide deacetylase family protein [Chitinophagaceae bacterium]|nr:polysaccharide deacetylase family protein [Chitinophagaceae bacterium]
MFYITSTPWWLKSIFPGGLTWMGNPSGGTIYLTFDDGPHPEITGFVLDLLKQANVKGTFFCIGENVERFPDTFNRIKEEGHKTGNHTHTHPDGWKMDAGDYLQEIQQADRLIRSDIFRPPYGKITREQVKLITEKMPGMRIIMWSGVTGDFDTRKTGNWCAQKAVRFAKPGNIIVFHDSEKAFPRLKIALPAVLEYMTKHHFTSKGL